MILSQVKEGSLQTVYVEGNLTFSGYDQFKEFFAELDCADVTKCAINFRYCDLIDSTGLGLVMYAYEYLQEKGVKLQVQDAQDRVFEAFRIANFAEFIEINLTAA